MRAIAALVVGMILVAAPAAADDAALGRISFPTSARPEAQPHFIRGMLLLHSFEYPDAAEAFREAQKVDPGFAMAYWGEALTYTHVLWDWQDAAAGRNVLARLGPSPEARAAKAPTAREKAYLSAAELLYAEPSRELAVVLRDYERAMAALARTYPDDDEAQALHALSILATNAQNRRFEVDARAAAILEEVFARNREHPGALHYLIHAYDNPTLAPLGLRPARLYGRIASGAAHALHMTSHIFVAMGMWDEAVRANEDSWAASAARVERKGLGIDENGFHAYLWLAYAYLQQGRIADAQRVVEHTRELASRSGSPRTVYHYAFARAYFIADGQTWSALPPALPSQSTPPSARAAELFAEGYAAVRTGSASRAAGLVDELEALTKSTGGAEAHHGKGRGFLSQGDRQAIAITAKQLAGLVAFTSGRKDEGERLLREAAEAEDVMSYMYGPPFPVKPARELLGEMLLEAGRPKEAQAEFARALGRAPKRARALEGLAAAAAAAGDRETADEAAATLKAIRRERRASD